MNFVDKAFHPRRLANRAEKFERLKIVRRRTPEAFASLRPNSLAGDIPSYARTVPQIYGGIRTYGQLLSKQAAI